ncbi:MAG: hypothetical protein ACRYF9_25760 [Janthinobacterium lividum]
MTFDNIILPPAILAASQRLLAAIVEADTPSHVVKAGAMAEGFVLGLETARTLEAARIEALYVLFDNATEKRLRDMAQAGK